MTSAQLLKALSDAEKIALVCREELAERRLNEQKMPLDDGSDVLFPSHQAVVKFQQGILEITVPITLSRSAKESWYLATEVRMALKEYKKTNGRIEIEAPVFTVCERVIPSYKSPVQDNDHFEVSRIINECFMTLGYSDHPLRMGYMSVVRVEAGKRYTKITVLPSKSLPDFCKKSRILIP